MKYIVLTLYILFIVCVSSLSKSINIPKDFKDIQEAIDKADLGDIIIISDGEYKEDIMINKSIELCGSGQEKTALKGSIVVQNAGPVIIESLTIRGDKGNNAHFGIYCSRAFLTIKNTKIFGYHHGIGSESSKLIIKDSFITENFQVGIQVENSLTTFIEENDINTNTGSGIRISSSENNITITGNIIRKNSIGIEIIGSSPRIRRNAIENNQVAIFSTQESNPDMGIDDDPGLNVFISNPVVIINMNRRLTIQAKGNYWGDPNGPNNSTIEGKIDYIPWLKSSPLKTQSVCQYGKLSVCWGSLKGSSMSQKSSF